MKKYEDDFPDFDLSIWVQTEVGKSSLRKGNLGDRLD